MKKSLTLIEVMIVILLIGLITAALAYNMSGSLDKGRVFTTEQNMARLKDILLIEHSSSDEPLDKIVANWEQVIARSPLVLKNGKDLMQDGWKVKFRVRYESGSGEIHITSSKLTAFYEKHKNSPTGQSTTTGQSGQEPRRVN